MRTRLLLLAAFLVLLGLGGVAGVYFYDDSKKDLIAEGVKVNGVPIGGMTTAQAEKKLSATLLAPLDRPVKVRYKDRTFTLTQKAASIGIDIRGSADKALQRSQEGDMFSRTWRNVRNKSLDTELAAEVSYNQPAIRKLVKRVQKSIDRKPVDAKVDLSEGSVEPTTSRTGVRVKYNSLAKAVEQTLLDPGNTESVRVQTSVVQPKVSTKDLAEKYPAVLIVNRKSFKLTLYKDLKLKKTYGIAVGKVGMDTPAGLYDIQNKAVNPAWHVPNSDWAGDLAGKVIPGDDPSNPIKSRWMGIYDGVGVHGTSDDSSIGSAASHGCIRMHIPDVEELYDEVPVGAPIYIALSLRPDGRRDAGLAAVDLVRCDLLPALLHEGGMVVGVANDQGADEDALRLLAHHRVPQGAGVAVPAHRVPGSRRQILRAHHASGDQPVPGGDLTRGRVDEEGAHAHPGYGGRL